MASLKTLRQPVDQWDTIIIHLARKHLSYQEQKDWQDTIKDRTPEDMPKLAEFIKFLTERTHTLQMLQSQKAKLQPAKPPPKTEKKSDKKPHQKVTLAATSHTCKYCGDGHPVNWCEKFTKLSIDERKKEVTRKNLCPNCLNPAHEQGLSGCKSRTCKKCNERHNTLLHQDQSSTAPVVTHVANASELSTSVAMYCMQKPGSQVILSTARILIRGSDGKFITCRALLDPASQSNIMTLDLAHKLNLTFAKGTRSISGVNQALTEAREVNYVQIKSHCSDYTAQLRCLVLPAVTHPLPQTRIDVANVIVPQGTQLADPDYGEPGNVDLLIGAGLYWKLLIGSPRNRVQGQPALQNTQLGWIVGGEVVTGKPNSVSTCLKVTNVQLHDQIERFWIQESIPESRHFTKEEKLCEEIFTKTTQRDENGRFVVSLPKRTNVTLGKSKQQALRRLEAVERKLKRNPELQEPT